MKAAATLFDLACKAIPDIVNRRGWYVHETPAIHRHRLELVSDAIWAAGRQELLRRGFPNNPISTCTFVAVVAHTAVWNVERTFTLGPNLN